ncbi:MAG: NAD(P)-dependent oxidoreductase [Gammaproteobacteria bacterium]|nr:NAD(P)-dependent oxidoreductase [Gammaproteobacteria bacterium]
MLAGKIFLVTGATGRLGCEIVFRLESLGAKVLPLVLPGYPLTPARIRWQAEAAPVAAEKTDDLAGLPVPDYVINLHWRVQRDLSYTAQLLYEVDYNLHRPVFLWEWLADKRIKRFANISSLKVFSELNGGLVTSETEPRPISPYGISKLAAEKFFDAEFARSACSVIHLRLGSVAAYGGHPSQLMCQLCASAFEQKRIRIISGSASHLLYIDEAADLIINAVLTGNDRQYILTAPTGMKNERIAREFERISGRKLNAEYVKPDVDAAEPAFVSDIPKLKSEWMRCVPFEKMAEKTVALYKQGKNR